MSVTVKHLNADSTFLLIFSPAPHPRRSDLVSSGGAFSVLIDPWLTGPSIVTAEWFAKTLRRVPSAIQNLSEIEEPDVLIVSQNKPDHCHKETLLQLPPESKTVIAAEPGAAKVIRGWNHFDPNRVHGLLRYDPKVRFGRSLRLRIPPLSAAGFPGELSISFIPAKSYLTGLHNAFGITYLPPTRTRAVAPIATVDLRRTTKYFHMPLSPVTLPPSGPPPPISPLGARPMSFDQPNRDSLTVPVPANRWYEGRTHRPRLSRASNTASSEFLSSAERPIVREGSKAPDQTENTDRALLFSGQSPSLDVPFQFELDPSPLTFVTALPSPPDSPASYGTSPGTASSASRMASSSRSTVSVHRHSSVYSHQRSLSSVSSMPNLSVVTPPRAKAISVIYAPHGLPLSDLQPYVQNHLVRLAGALPLTLLLHSFDHAQNPWFLGGNIMTGMKGGTEIAQALMARCWISAHDEAKDDRGLSVKKLRVKRGTAEEVRKHLWEGEPGEWLRKRGWICDVRSLDVGKEMLISPPRDLCAGMEDKRESRLMRFGVDDSSWKG